MITRHVLSLSFSWAIPASYVLAALFLPALRGSRAVFIAACAIFGSWLGLLLGALVAPRGRLVTPSQPDVLVTADFWPFLIPAIAIPVVYYAFSRAAKNPAPADERQPWWANLLCFAILATPLIPWQAWMLLKVQDGWYLLVPDMLLRIFAIGALIEFWRRTGRLCPIPSGAGTRNLLRLAFVVSGLGLLVVAFVLTSFAWSRLLPWSSMGGGAGFAIGVGVYLVGAVGGVGYLIALALFEIVRWKSHAPRKKDVIRG